MLLTSTGCLTDVAMSPIRKKLNRVELPSIRHRNATPSCGGVLLPLIANDHLDLSFS